MLFKELQLNDFRLFQGNQVLNLDIPEGSNKNVILIGGLNGAGKTSLLEAIKLGIYGRRAVPQISEEDSYEEIITRSINQVALKQGKNNFGVNIIFKKEGVQQTSELIVSRNWSIEPNRRIHEEFLLKEEENLSDFMKEDWEEYLSELVPLGIAQFFFFDGEKIQQVASDNKYEKKLVDAIKEILNINLYDRLYTDLVYYEKTKRYEDCKGTSQELDQQNRDILTLGNIINTKEQEIQELEENITSIEKEIQVINEWLKRYGVTEYSERMLIEKEKKSYEERRDELNKKLKSFAKEILPFIIILPRLKELKQRINEEAEAASAEILKNSLDQKMSNFIVTVLEKSEENIKLEGRDKLKEYLSDAWKEVFFESYESQKRNVLKVSDVERNKILSKIIEVEKQLKDGPIKKIIDELNTIETKLRKLRQVLIKLPEDQEYVDKENTRNELLMQIGFKKRQITHIEQEITSLTNKRANALSKLSQIEKRLEITRRTERKILESQKTRNVLEIFIKKLTIEKSMQVQHWLNYMYRLIARKNVRILTFRINPDDFFIRLIGDDGKEVPKASMSAGEKEIFAISMIWALSKASNKDLPVIIDTPLARLDGMHRNQIISQYLPSASKQVIILSTDTEIDEVLYYQLKPYIAKEYMLEYLYKENRTVIKEGFFWG